MTTVDLRKILGLLVAASLALAVCLPVAADSAAAAGGGGGAISGAVRSFVSGLPVEATVDLLSSSGTTLDFFTTGADGHYEFTGLAAGDYHLAANSQAEGLAVELWPDVICFTGTQCNLGQLVTVSSGGTTIADFSLDTLGTISGRVVDAETGAPVGGGQVLAHYLSGVEQGLDGAQVDADGYYQILGMTPGTWRLVSIENPNHIEKVFGGPNCEAGCDPWTVGGTTIDTQLNQGTTIADLALSFGPGLAGWAFREGTAAAGLAVDIFDDGGGLVTTVGTEADGRFRISMAPGTYYLATDNGPGYIDQVYQGVPCPDGPASQGMCNPLDGDAVTVVATEPAVDPLVFDLASPSSVFRDSFESGDFVAWSLVLGN